jgi:hypothetical protein
MLATGIGASVARKEDERFLRGRGQYVGDFRIPGTREVSFVRSPVAHARLKSVSIPEKHKSTVVTADDLASVNPIRAATSVGGFKPRASPTPFAAASPVRSPEPPRHRGRPRATGSPRPPYASHAAANGAGRPLVPHFGRRRRARIQDDFRVHQRRPYRKSPRSRRTSPHSACERKGCRPCPNHRRPIGFWRNVASRHRHSAQ